MANETTTPGIGQVKNTIQVNARISQELYKMLVSYCRLSGLKEQEVIRAAVSEYLLAKNK